MTPPSASAPPISVEEAKRRLLETPALDPAHALADAARKHLWPATIVAAASGLTLALIPRRFLARSFTRFAMPIATEMLRRALK